MRNRSTLREACGSHDGRGRSRFPDSCSTLAQRIVRAKSKIRDAGSCVRDPIAYSSNLMRPTARQCVVRDLSGLQRRLSRLRRDPSLTRREPFHRGNPTWVVLAAFELLPEPEAMGLLIADAVARSTTRRPHVPLSASGVVGAHPSTSRTIREIAHSGIESTDSGGRSYPRRARARIATHRADIPRLQAAIAAVHAEARSRRLDRLAPDRGGLYDCSC